MQNRLPPETATCQPQSVLLPPWDRFYDLLHQGHIVDASAYWVRQAYPVPVSELTQALNGSLPVDGHWAIFAAPGTVVATGLSRELADLIIGLIEARKIYLRPMKRIGQIRPFAGPLTLTTPFRELPSARHAHGYRTPHFMWCELWPGYMEG